MSNTYNIYIRSEGHPRTVNTPAMGRTCYEVIRIEGKEAFTAKLNELVTAGEQIAEVRHGWSGSYVRYWEYIIN